mmetsp:Transcript_50806/g.145832  ORF Transcript_50806/g.145832 Transcript_50806/m.145832 type:complete len:524 (-) Transcript_50806:316-1887(-)
MESEYGLLFLSNYHCAPLLREAARAGAVPAAAASVDIVAKGAFVASSPPVPAVGSAAVAEVEQFAVFPELPEDAAAAAAPGGSSPFSLAPPPAPTAACAVGFRLAPPPTPNAACSTLAGIVPAAAAASPRAGGVGAGAGITVIETLIEPHARRNERPPAAMDAKEEEEAQDEIFNVMGIRADNDEEGLLGDCPQAPSASPVALVAGDGIDSPWESEGDLGAPGAGGAAIVERKRAPKATQLADPPFLARLSARSAQHGGGGSGRDPLGDLVAQEAEALERLDRFFNDDQIWNRLAQELANLPRVPMHKPSAGAAARMYRVQVPKPYPGVQYRRSQNLEDRYPRYAKHGSIVSGVIDKDGEWLCISSKEFLPLRVGSMSILEALREGEVPTGSQETVELGSGDRLTGGDTGGSGSGGNSRPGAKLQPPSGAAEVAAVERAVEQLRGGKSVGDPAAQQALLREAARRALPEAVSRNPLSNVDELNRHLSASVNPFSNGNSPDGGATPTRTKSPPRPRPVVKSAKA